MLEKTYKKLNVTGVQSIHGRVSEYIASIFGSFVINEMLLIP